jgi:hypothetical protein
MEFIVSDLQIWLLTLYDKNEAADLTTRERHLLKIAIEKGAAALPAARTGKDVT